MSSVDWSQITKYAVSGSFAIIGVIASYIEIRNHLTARRIQNATSRALPLHISKSLKYSDFERAIKLVVQLLDSIRFQPDFVVGIHYTGLSYAALLAKELYVPVLHVEVEYSDTGDHHMADVVTLRFDTSRVKSKRVLIVDNRMATGNTMKLVKDQLHAAGAIVKTMVFYRHSYENSVIIPDIVLFTSKQPLETLLR